MSGGARNLYVENCNFIGTDIGLRFKTTRGRGGIVENIFIKNITMKDIAGEAILFDMYYAAVDPVPLAGEKQEPPKVQALPVSEETPQFRNFYIKNVTCSGALKGIYVRELPEMSVKNIMLKNMVLQSDKGLDMTEATDFMLSDIRFITKISNPVLNIHNSRNINLDNIAYNTGADLQLNVSGEKSNKISVTKTDITKTKEKVQFTYVATESALQLK